MVKVKIIDGVNNTILEELLFAYDEETISAVAHIQDVVSYFTENKIQIEFERVSEPCSTYSDELLIASKIFRRINSVNPYNKN